MFSKELLAAYRLVEIASISDAVDQVAGKRGYLEYGIENKINRRRIIGPAITVSEGPADEAVPPTHALDLIDASEEGSVIVIATGGEKDLAVWGGLMTAGAVANKLSGAVLEAGVRDIEEIRRDYDFPVYASTVSPGTTLGRFKTLSANTTVTIGGVEVSPGDLIVGHTDGVVVVPKDNVEEVLRVAQQIDQKEAEQARLILEAGSLRKGLEKYGRI